MNSILFRTWYGVYKNTYYLKTVRPYFRYFHIYQSTKPKVNFLAVDPVVELQL